MGARLHVITDWKPYFGAGGDPMKAPCIWQGGLGIWGAIAGGALGVYISARRRHLYFVVMADAVTPAPTGVTRRQPRPAATRQTSTRPISESGGIVRTQ